MTGFGLVGSQIAYLPGDHVLGAGVASVACLHLAYRYGSAMDIGLVVFLAGCGRIGGDVRRERLVDEALASCVGIGSRIVLQESPDLVAGLSRKACLR